MEEKQPILHELYVFSEWKPEPEYLQKPDNILPESISALWRWVRFFGPKKSLIDSVTAYKEKQQKWHIALGDEGKVIAVLTDNILEIRTKRSEYATIAARTTVARDAYPQWRKVVWSPDCSFIAVAYGNGAVSFFDLTASQLFTIPTECSRPGGMECTDNTHAVAEIIFTPLRVKDNKWSWEVVIATYDGRLRNYLVSQTAGFKLQHAGSAGEGVGAAVYSDPHALLYVASLPRGKDPSSALHAGLTAWRATDEPSYKLSTISDALEDDKYQFYVPFLGDKKMAFIVNMALSPNNNTLVCLHCTGEVSAWRLPLLKLIQRWPLLSQPQHDISNPLLGAGDKRDKTAFLPADVNWWTEEAIILSRFSGAVSICTLEDLENILGSKPEFLQGAPRVSAAHDGAFVALECETSVLPPVRRSEESTELVEQDNTEDTVYEISKELVKTLLYAITDMETFQPRPRRVTVVARVYRLLGLKSTTPDELFSRKIESGQYAAALTLADTFHLDSDLVFQHQWRKTPVSADSIRKYLSKISKKIWAVHQCVDRLPETLSAAKELLQFGLDLTNEEILKEINKDREEPITDTSVITLNDLNAYSSELLRCRHVMLFNRERLKLYEAILRCEKSTYVKDEYDRLRSHSLIHSATELAKEGRLSALTCLWPHIASIELQMAVLEKVPETIDPYEYRDLLPTLLKAKRLKPVKLQQEVDWCRNDEFRSIWSSNWSEVLTPDSEESNCTAEEISKWYKKRATQIEELSGIVSHAVSLLSIAAQDRGVEDLEDLMFHIKTLDTLVYDLNLENVCLKEVKEWSPMQTCCKLMSGSTKETFVSSMQKYVLPYLCRLSGVGAPGGSGDEMEARLVEFLKSYSEEDLTYTLMALQSARQLDINVKTHLKIVSECLFAYNGHEQLEVANDIVESLPDDTDGSIHESVLKTTTASLQRLMCACACVWQRGSPTTLTQLRAAAADAKAADTVVTGIARSLAIRDDKPTLQDWEKLLKDILELQSTFFTCLSLEKCHEIYALSLLTSGDAPSIRQASEVLTCQSSTRVGHLVPYERSVALVTAAAREYFNSASSLTDPALELAKCCLSLIKDGNPQIQEELDLIAALGILSSFHMNILPIQVRLCEEKMTLVDECLKQDHGAYLASHKLLKLAKLLRVSADDIQKREGEILELVCSHALGIGPVGGAAAALAARRLYLLRHPAAKLLATVAENTQAHANIHDRRDLYAAAATFCKGQALEKMLKARLDLEIQGLRQAGLALREHRLLSERCPSADDEFADAVTTPVIEKKDLVPPPPVDKKLPLLNYLVDSWQNKFGMNAGTKAASKAEQVEKVPACPEFYRSLYPQLAPSSLDYSYCGFSPPAQTPLGPYAALLLYYTDTKSKRDEETYIVQKCAEDLIYKDTPLAVACLLRAADSPKLCIEGVRKSNELLLAVCTLYAALIKCNHDKLYDEVYLAAPVQMARKTITKNHASPEQMELIRACLDKLETQAESERLKKLGYNVDRTFFNNDKDYRRETLFRMARSQNVEHLDFAYSLARKYKIDPLSVWAAHAQTVISSAPLRTLPDSLLPGSTWRLDATHRMREGIWPEISGTDYNALINYFTLLNQIDEKTVQQGLLPADHVRLLKKAKAASQELDYKLLLDQPPSDVFLAHILKIIKPENVGLLAKFLRNLPAPIKSPVLVNLMYTTWLTRFFFSIPPANESSKKWFQQYRECASYFNKLTKDDVLKLAEETCFSDEAVKRVPGATRQLMLLQTVDYCQQEHESEHKSSLFELSWGQVGQELARWARFLENYHSTTIQALIANHSAPRDNIWPEVEKSHGDQEKIRVPLCRLVLERDIRRSALITLIQCLNIDTSVERIFSEVLDKVRSSLDLATLVSRVAAAHKEGARLSPDYIERVMAKCTSCGLPPHKQIALLALTQLNAPAAGDVAKLLQYTVDLFANTWPGEDLVSGWTEETLQDPVRRWECFKRLLNISHTWAHKRALVDLLSFWPPTRSKDGPKSLHYELLQYLLDNGDQKESLALIKLLLSRGAVLTEEEITLLTNNVKFSSVLNALWVLLLSKCEPSLRAVPPLLRAHMEYLQNAEVEDELIKECLDSGLFAQLVGTPLYAHIINHILQDISEPYNAQWAIAQLTENKFQAEAGHLQMMVMGVPLPLRRFTQSVLMLKQCVFNKK